MLFCLHLLPFVPIIHVFGDMEIPKPSTNPHVGLLELLFVFHDELTFFVYRLGFMLHWLGPLRVRVQFPNIALLSQIGN
jgi:hypothetical protein